MKKTKDIIQFVTGTFTVDGTIYNVSLAPLLYRDKNELIWGDRFCGILIDHKHGTIRFEIEQTPDDWDPEGEDGFWIIDNKRDISPQVEEQISIIMNNR